jgi:hypothetical protein
MAWWLIPDTKSFQKFTDARNRTVYTCTERVIHLSYITMPRTVKIFGDSAAKSCGIYS